MNAAAERRSAGPGDWALLWLASMIVLGASCFTAFASINAAIDAQDRMTAGVGAALRANARILARRPHIAHQVSGLALRLRDLQYQAGKPTAIARFISIVSWVAARQGVSIIQIDGREAALNEAGFGAPAGRQSTENSTASLPLEVTLRGSYRALLATIRDLAQAPLIMRIDVAAIERATGADADGPLLASLHVVLERVTADAPPSPTGPVPPEEPALNARPL